MNATWSATKTVAYELVIRQLQDQEDEVDFTGGSTTPSRTRSSSTSKPTSTKSKAKASATEAPVNEPSWVELNPSTTIAACILGVSGTILVVLALWCYIKLRNKKLLLALENTEVEAGRAAIEEKERQRLAMDGGDGTYPHFGASHAPVKQENTYNDAMLDEGYSDPTYPVASDGSTIPDSLPLDSIPEEMEAPHEHYSQKDNKHGKKIKNERRIMEEDLEEGLRTSQMEGTRSSHEHEIEIESLQDPPEQTPSGAHRVPNPSPASNLSTGSYNEDPRLVRPELRRMQAHQPRMDSADSDGRDSVYSPDGRTKYA